MLYMYTGKSTGFEVSGVLQTVLDSTKVARSRKKFVTSKLLFVRFTKSSSRTVTSDRAVHNNSSLSFSFQLVSV